MAMQEFGGEVDIIPLDSFRTKVLPPLPKDVDVAAVKKLLTTRGLLSLSGFGAMLKSEKADRLARESEYYAPLAAVHQAISDAAISLRNGSLSPTLYYSTCGEKSPASDRPSSSKPDGYHILLKGQESHSSHWAAAGKEPPDNWLDIVRCDEYKKKEDKHNLIDDIEKVFWSAHHILCNDPRRRFTFGLTIEGSDTRIWFFNRQTVLVSQSFDYMTEPDHFIHLVLSLTFASICDLGYDITMKLFKHPTKPTFDYEIAFDGRIYRTDGTLSDCHADAIRGRASRLYKANEIIAGQACDLPVVVKDTWPDSDRPTEGQNLRDVLADLPEEFHQYLRRIERDGYVHVNGAVDTTSSHIRELRVSAVSELRLSLTPSLAEVRPQRSRGLMEDADHANASSVGYTYYPKSHYRVVFKDLCQPLENIRQWPIIYRILGDVVKVIDAMFTHGQWVHRDLSTGNILIHEGRLQLSDFEFASRIDFEGTHHEMRTGTLPFMACEVRSLKYCFTMPSTGQQDLLPEAYGRNMNKPQRIPLNKLPVIYHTLHDLESIWWILMRFLWRFVPNHPDPGWSVDSLDIQDTSSEHFFEDLFARVHTFSKLDCPTEDLVDDYCRDVIATFALQFQEELVRSYTYSDADLTTTGKLRYDNFPAVLQNVQKYFGKGFDQDFNDLPDLVHIHDYKKAMLSRKELGDEEFIETGRAVTKRPRNF